MSKKPVKMSQGVALDRDVKKELEAESSRQERSMSWLVNKALRQFLGLDKKVKDEDKK